MGSQRDWRHLTERSEPGSEIENSRVPEKHCHATKESFIKWLARANLRNTHVRRKQRVGTNLSPFSSFVGESSGQGLLVDNWSNRMWCRCELAFSCSYFHIRSGWRLDVLCWTKCPPPRGAQHLETMGSCYVGYRLRHMRTRSKLS